MKIIPFMPEHAIALAGTAIGAEYAAKLQAAGPAVTFLEDGAPVAVGGLAILFAGVAEAWCVIGEAPALPLVRSLRRLLDLETAMLGLHRIQAHARADADGACRLLVHLGFAAEGLARAFGPDRSDHVLYGRVTCS
jgi:hypothetical protein